ncbi:MAG: MarR family transcriptional regulator [Clostridia bacterium]|nr:MarR family transcriptional regulator [Clostridia bacterium]
MDKNIGFEIKTLSHLIKRRIDKFAGGTNHSGLTGGHGWIIGYLYDKSKTRDVFQRDLEAEFSIRRSTATGILKLMEKNGLIVKEPVEKDARLKKLVLTPKAVALHEKVISEFNKMEEQLSRGLTEEEKEMFFKVIDKIKNNIIS